MGPGSSSLSRTPLARRQSRGSRATRTAGDGGDSKKGAMCVPLAVTHLSGDAFFYDDIEGQLEKSDNNHGFGFTWWECQEAIRRECPEAYIKRLPGFRNDPEQVLQRLKDTKFEVKQFLVFGILKDDRPLHIRRIEGRAKISTLWHCGCVDLNLDKNQWWCAWKMENIPLDEGIRMYSSIQAVLGFNRWFYKNN